MYGLTRATTTLLGVAVAGLMIWLAGWVGRDGSTAEYWAFIGLLAGAGLVLALSQLLGGWTKWGRPAISPLVLLLAFLPTLVVSGFVLAAAQPGANAARDTARDWVDAAGLTSVLETLVELAPVVAFGLGLVLGLVFDTTGARRREEVVDADTRVAEEPVAAEREHAATVDREPAHTEPHLVTVGTGDPERDRPPVDGREPGTPAAPQPDPSGRPRRRLFGR